MSIIYFGRLWLLKFPLRGRIMHSMEGLRLQALLFSILDLSVLFCQGMLWPQNPEQIQPLNCGLKSLQDHEPKVIYR